MSGQCLNIIYAFLFALAKADFLNDGRKRFSDDLDHLAGNQSREDRALSDADSGIPEGDQVQADDCQDSSTSRYRNTPNATKTIPMHCMPRRPIYPPGRRKSPTIHFVKLTKYPKIVEKMI